MVGGCVLATEPLWAGTVRVCVGVWVCGCVGVGVWVGGWEGGCVGGWVCRRAHVCVCECMYERVCVRMSVFECAPARV